MEYKKTLQTFPNGTNVNHIPLLSDEERKRREKILEEATARFLRNAEREKHDRERTVLYAGANAPAEKENQDLHASVYV